MKINSFALFLTFLVSFFSSKEIIAQSILPFPTEHNTLLWKISGNGITKDCYVFGTMHLIEKQYFVFPKSLQNKIKNCNRLIMEIADVNQADALQYIMLENGSITDFFTRKQLDTLYNWSATTIGMDSTMLLKSFGKMKPFILTQLTTQLSFSGETESYEKSIQTLTDGKKIPNFGLETIQEQLSFFDKLTNEEQAEMVMAATREKDNGKAKMKEIMELYQKQNVDILYNAVHNETGAISDNEALFLSDRNKNWIPKLKTHFTEGKCFVAVGAAHLGGPEGVLRLLQNEGFTITPIKL
jgi:uncharacterized protein YbaP (TraB family)